MYFSERLIQSLILDLALGGEYCSDSVHNLVYHLGLPGTAVPYYVAEVIAHAPPISAEQSRFPQRLAYGVLDDALLCYDPSLRNQRQAKLFRKIDLIQLGLKKQQFPDEVISLVRRHFSELRLASESIRCLAVESREVAGPELAALLEKVVVSAIEQSSLLQILLQRLIDRFDGVERHRLYDRARQGIDSGLNNPPLEAESLSGHLLQLDEPVRFRNDLVSQQSFAPAAEMVLDHLDALCH